MVDEVVSLEAELFLDFRNSCAICIIFWQLNFRLVQNIIAHLEMLLPYKSPFTVQSISTVYELQGRIQS